MFTLQVGQQTTKFSMEEWEEALEIFSGKEGETQLTETMGEMVQNFSYPICINCQQEELSVDATLTQSKTIVLLNGRRSWDSASMQKLVGSGCRATGELIIEDSDGKIVVIINSEGTLYFNHKVENPHTPITQRMVDDENITTKGMLIGYLVASVVELAQ